MKISATKLQEIINSLPDPKKYWNDTIRIVIQEPITIARLETKPSKATTSFRELEFRKESTYRGLDWIIEVNI